MPAETEDKKSIDSEVLKSTYPGMNLPAKLAIGVLLLWGLCKVYDWTFVDNKDKIYQNIPELILVDSLYHAQMNAINLSDESFSSKRAQRNSVKKEYDFKVNFIKEAYRENFGK